MSDRREGWSLSKQHEVRMAVEEAAAAKGVYDAPLPWQHFDVDVYTIQAVYEAHRRYGLEHDALVSLCSYVIQMGRLCRPDHVRSYRQMLADMEDKIPPRVSPYLVNLKPKRRTFG